MQDLGFTCPNCKARYGFDEGAMYDLALELADYVAIFKSWLTEKNLDIEQQEEILELDCLDELAEEIECYCCAECGDGWFDNAEYYPFVICECGEDATETGSDDMEMTFTCGKCDQQYQAEYSDNFDKERAVFTYLQKYFTRELGWQK